MVAQNSWLHVRVDGRSVDIPLRDLDIGDLSSDHDVAAATAQYLDVPARMLRDHVIDRHETGNLTMRPQAVFG
ncbi:MAG: hypothetical protein ACYTGL_14965 [Planctomycetota bacterium]